MEMLDLLGKIVFDETSYVSVDKELNLVIIDCACHLSKEEMKMFEKWYGQNKKENKRSK